jgi:putative transposase
VGDYNAAQAPANARLKKLVANQALDIDMLKEISVDAPIDVKC